MIVKTAKEDSVMATLDELVHYCRSKNSVGTFMLTGEWGTGKTHLIEKELAGALKDTHVIVRVSLFGLSTVEALQKAVREKWINACSPTLGKLAKNKEQANSVNGGFFTALRTVMKSVNPVAGAAADLMVSFNVMDMIPITPEIEDMHAHERKQVVLVFDDLERSKMSLPEMIGMINEYCENQHFPTIAVTNEAYLIHSMKEDLLTYGMLKGKTVSRTVYYVPDFEKILHQIINERRWGSDAYKSYLQEKESEILSLFASGQPTPRLRGNGMSKTHNLLVLTSTLDDFYRIFSHLKKVGVENPDKWLYSFLAYSIGWKGGIVKDGELCFNCSEEDVKAVYPMFEPEYLTEAIRNWISYGIWDREQFAGELAMLLEKLN